MESNFETISSLIRRQGWLVAGLTAYWHLFRNPYTIALFSSPQVAEASGFLDLSLGYSCLLVCWALVFSAASRGWNIVASLRFSPLAFGLTIVLGNCVVTGSFSNSPISPYAVLAGMVMTSFGFAALTTWVLERFEKLAYPSVVVVALVSFVASHVFVVLDFMQGGLAFLPVVIPPLLSGIFFSLPCACRIGDSSAGRKEDEPSARTDVFGMGQERINMVDGAAFNPRLAIVCLSLDFVLLCIMRALWTFDRHGYNTGPLAVITYVISALAGCCLFVMSFYRKSNRNTSLLCILFVSLLSLIGFCLHFFVEFGTCVISVARTAVQLLLLVHLAGYARENKAQSIAVEGVAFFSIDLAGAVFSHILSGLLFDVPQISVADLVAPLSLVCMLIVSFMGICMLVIQLAAQSRAVEKMAKNYVHAGSVDHFNSDNLATPGIMKFAKHYGLTERESDIVALLARGRSVKIISKTLCVSQSTVQAHMKSVYRKLGIHSKQSLLDLLEEADRSASQTGREVKE